MKKLGGLLTLIVIVALLIVLNASLYIVDETQQVVLTRFGKPVGAAVTTPGLKIKVPFIDTVNRFEKRFLAWDGDRNQLPTRDKRFIYVDTYARWRITDPLKFFQRLRDLRGAQSRLDDILDGETRNTIARYDLIEVVRSTNREFEANDDLSESNDRVIESIEFGRADLTEEVLATAQTRVGDLGIEILDFRFKRLNYVNEVRQEVYARMISERNRIAEKFRAEGAGEAARISGEKDKELKLIQSEAYRDAQVIKGRADAEAADLYAAAYNRDPDFYRFLKSLEVLKVTLDKDTTLLLGTDGDLLRYLEKMR